MPIKLISKKTKQAAVETDLALQAGAAFPTARYFQIHFEFLQEQLQQTLAELRSLKLQLQQLEQSVAVPPHSAGLAGLECRSVKSGLAAAHAVVGQPGRG